jgi:hypothetical protein
MVHRVLISTHKNLTAAKKVRVKEKAQSGKLIEPL